MGARALFLTAVAATALATGCSGDATPDPVPSPSPTPTSAPTSTGSPVPTDDDCPPITGAEQTVTLPRGATAPLPDGGRILLREVRPGTDPTAVLEVTRTTAGCEGPFVLDVPAGSSASSAGVKVAVVAVDASTGGMPPTAQIRFGPPD